MNERQIGLGCVYAGVWWAATFFFIAAGTIVGIVDGDHTAFAVAVALMAHGLACSAAAATFTIRNMLIQQDQKLQSAFDLGCETRGVRRISG